MSEVADTYRVHQDFVLPPLAAQGGAVTAASAASRSTLVAVYHDTDDLRLGRAGVTLRRDSCNGESTWALSLPAPGGEGTQREITRPGVADEVPQDLRTLLRSRLGGGAPLVPRSTLRTRRAVYQLLGASGEVLADLVDEAVETAGAGHGKLTLARFRDLQVADRGGGPQPVLDVGRALLEAGAVPGKVAPAVVGALDEGAIQATDPPAPAPVAKRDPVRDLVAAVLCLQAHELLDHELAVHLGHHDGVQRLRVTARRLRSLLRDLDPLLSGGWAAGLQGELHWLGRALAPAREAQAMRERLVAATARLPAELDGTAARGRIERVLGAEVATAAGVVRETLGGDRYLALVAAVLDAARAPATSEAAEQPCRRALPPIVAASRARLRGRFRRALLTPEPAVLDRARLAAERARYLAEALDVVYGKDARRFAARVRRAQEVLGEHQDAILAARTVQRVAAGSRSPQAAFALGVVFAREQGEQRRARKRFERAAGEVVAPQRLGWAEQR